MNTPLFFLGDQSAISVVSTNRENSVFDEAFAESRRLKDDPTARQFLGLTLHPKRLWWAGVLVIAIFSVFIFQAARLQLMNGGSYRALAEGNRVNIKMIPAMRGIIYDRHHQPLATNAPLFRVLATPYLLPQNQEERIDALTRLSEVADASVAEMLARLAEQKPNGREAIVLIDHVSYEHALRLLVSASSFPGIQVEETNQRSYITTTIPTLSHILGYTGRINAEEYDLLKQNGYRSIDDLGKSGVEKIYEKELRGVFGRQEMEVNARGKEIRVITKEDAVNGQNVLLSIDAALTAKIEEVLAETVGTEARAAVVMEDPNNGELLALVSTPSFDANVFTQGISSVDYQALLNNPNQPLFDRAIGGTYPPGSTFKPVIAAAALAEGIIDQQTTFLSVGGLQVGLHYFEDWKAGGHGLTNVTRALAESINTFFYYIGGGYDTFVGLGIDRMMDYAKRFGFGSTLGIDLPGEASGFLPSKAWKEEAMGDRWYVGDSYNTAIGEGAVALTPLQVTAMTSVFANGGTLYKPHVVRAFETESGDSVVTPIVLESSVIPNQEAINIVRQGMRQTVESGSGRRLQSLPVTAAGKTGTAQWANNKPTHAWFTGFAPYENPQVVITVLVQEGGGGDVTAVPIAEKILQWWFTQYRIEKELDDQ